MEKQPAHILILLRHGESTWNQENRFTGWTDVPLSDVGFKEAESAGLALKNKEFKIDVAFTSVLQRAITTCNTVLSITEQAYVPVIKSWRLNERHYGSLQGLNKSEVASKYGEAQVKIWRRSYDVPPPVLDKKQPSWEGNHEMYKYLPKDVIPCSESLELTIQRVLPFWYDAIAPALLKNQTVLVTAHGNSLRGLVKHLQNMSKEEVLELNIPTAVPLVFELDESLKPIRYSYLMDEASLAAKLNAVAAQGQSNAPTSA